ncbi:P1 family peptidase [Fodinicurvata halophila]|uniref:P1 family peptidase n=1 Tax=Fodinicurvata halophila TaxID=1419723 RepID=A0ABV8ULR9_9PROT
MKPGARNLITDVPGLKVGNAQDDRVKSGTTVVLADQPAVASVEVMGGAPGSRETDLLAPDKTVQGVDALVLSGGSAFGLDAASGVADALRAAGRGFAVGDVRVPIVPSAILFDMLNGGDKDWGSNPYRALGAAALETVGEDFALGTVGAGTGATTAELKGGLGSASLVLDSGHTVGALVAVNAFGSANVPGHPHFWAAPFEVGEEFGGLGPCPEAVPLTLPKNRTLEALNAKANTTIAIVATDAVLTKPQAQRMASVAHDGMARSLVPSHTPLDGDLVFSLAIGARPLEDPASDLMLLGHAGAVCLARAISRGVHAATPMAGDTLPTWTQEWA